MKGMSNVQPTSVQSGSTYLGPTDCDYLASVGSESSNPALRGLSCENGVSFQNNASLNKDIAAFVGDSACSQPFRCYIPEPITTKSPNETASENLDTSKHVTEQQDENLGGDTTDSAFRIRTNNFKKNLSSSHPGLCLLDGDYSCICDHQLRARATSEILCPAALNLSLPGSMLGSFHRKRHASATLPGENQNSPPEVTVVPTGEWQPAKSEVGTGILNGQLGEESKMTVSWSATEKKKHFTTYQKLTLFCLCIASFTSFLSMSIIAPFFPYEASLKGMTDTVSGFVFSIYALVTMVCSPLFGKLIPLLGIRFCFLSGMFISGTCNILFGFLDKISDLTTFTVFCLVVRAFEALGAAAFSTASYSFIMATYPDDMGIILGIYETFVGLGMSIGPAIGGVLYSVGGYGVPFYALGTVVIMNLPVAWYLLKPTEANMGGQKSGSYLQLLKMPQVLILCSTLMLTAQAEAFLDPTLEPHLRQYGLGVDVVGLLFLLLSATYALSSPMVGWLVDKFKYTGYPIMVLGLLVQALSLMFMGPSPVMPFDGVLWVAIVSIAVNGIAIAMAFIPTFQTIMQVATENGMMDEVSTYGVVSGLWNGVFSMGEVLGPVIGGLLLDLVGFPWAATVIAACCLIAAVLTLGPMIHFFMKASKRDARDGPTEHTPLLSGGKQLVSCHDTAVLT